MSLPTIEPLPDENADLPPARRRRLRRMIVPPESSDRADFLRELAYRMEPSFDFFLFSLLAGLVLGIGLLLDSPALIVLAALLAPFMAPMLGLSLGTITGAMRFLLQSFASLGIGSLIVFMCGTLAGWAVNLLPARVYQQAIFHSQFSWPDFFVVALGVGLTTYLIVRSPNQRPLVTSVAIAYGLYLPMGAAGFGLSSGISGLWPTGLGLFFIHMVWGVLVGTLVLALLGLRPLNAVGYIFGGIYLLLGLAAIATLYMPQIINQVTTPLLEMTPPARPGITTGLEGEQMTPTSTPTATQPTTTFTPSPSVTATRTLVPSGTPTLTITPKPTPVWARISVIGSDGALIRDKPDFTGKVVQSILNGTLVEVLPEVVDGSGTAWVHIRLANEKEGWIVRTLLRTATPAPG